MQRGIAFALAFIVVRASQADTVHYTTLEQITPQNVINLQVAWSYDTGDSFGAGPTSSELECNPIVVDGVMYVETPKLKVLALDAATGRRLWMFDPALGSPPVRSKQRSRGVTYWQSGRDRRIFITFRQFLFALDARTGRIKRDFGRRGKVDLREGLGRNVESISVNDPSPGVIFKDLLILGSSGAAPGDIRAFDVRTGRLRWAFHTIPHPGELGYDTWPKDAWRTLNGANAWAGLTIDSQRGLVFVPTASAGMGDRDFYGADRSGDNLFADSILALQADTGRLIWHFQGVRHDLWDRDFPAPPTLASITRAGQRVDVIAQITKAGWIFVLERETGKSLFPIQEQPAPPSDVPGEQAAPFQPVPMAPAPFARQTLTESELTQRTPAAHAAVLEEFRHLRAPGAFVPPSLPGSILFPGLDGGGEWGGAAFDPNTHWLYVNANEMAWVLRLKPAPVGAGNSGRAIYLRECAGCHRADRTGNPPEVPALTGIGGRLQAMDMVYQIYSGGGRMPGFAGIGVSRIESVVDYLRTGKDQAAAPSPAAAPSGEPEPKPAQYIFDGYVKFLDLEGYPAINPPWGTLTAIDLDSGNQMWKIPLGEYPELARQGLDPTGTENYGGAVVTGNGLLFIGATIYDNKLRCFDKRTGTLLWETELPAAGNATPTVYEAKGREYVVIAAGGGKNVHGKPGGTYVAYSLPLTPPERPVQ